MRRTWTVVSSAPAASASADRWVVNEHPPLNGLDPVGHSTIDSGACGEKPVPVTWTIWRSPRSSAGVTVIVGGGGNAVESSNVSGVIPVRPPLARAITTHVPDAAAQSIVPLGPGTGRRTTIDVEIAPFPSAW